MAALKLEEAAAAGPASGGGEAAGPSDRDKKLRNLQKKLRQIEQLKDRRDAGATLEPEQVRFP